MVRFWYSLFNHNLPLVLHIQPWVYLWSFVLNQSTTSDRHSSTSTSHASRWTTVYHWSLAFNHVYFWCLAFSHGLPLVLGVQPRLLLILAIQPWSTSIMVYHCFLACNNGLPLVLGIQPRYTTGSRHSTMVYFWYLPFNHGLPLVCGGHPSLHVVLCVQPQSTTCTLHSITSTSGTWRSTTAAIGAQHLTTINFWYSLFNHSLPPVLGVRPQSTCGTRRSTTVYLWYLNLWKTRFIYWLSNWIVDRIII